MTNESDDTETTSAPRAEKMDTHRGIAPQHAADERQTYKRPNHQRQTRETEWQLFEQGALEKLPENWQL